MGNGEPKLCDQIRDILERHHILDEEVEIQNATKFKVKNGTSKAAINVFNTGKMNVEGSATDLKRWLTDLKIALESASPIPTALLPEEFDKLPEKLKAKIPQCDDVVMWFYEEAFRCFRNESTAASAFMLGAASEKLILLLIDTYANSIDDETNRTKFQSRLNNRMISVRFEEFMKSYKSSKPRPTDLRLTQDLEQIIETAFFLFRTTRNTVGHPQIIPEVEKGVMIANLAHFFVYTERIYLLMEFFSANRITV